MNSFIEVIKIIPIDKKKKKITFEDGSCLSLYCGEIRRLNITEGTFMSQEILDEIYGILRKRARERSLYLLKDSDKTEKQIKDKLREGFYPEEIIEETLEFLHGYNYIDDERYCTNYINTKKDKKSIRQISSELYRKGIDKDIVKKVLEDEMNGIVINPHYTILGLLKKKNYDPCNDDYKYKNRILSSLAMKGFNYDDIIDAMNGFKEDSN